jgi:hypothetical protein
MITHPEALEQLSERIDDLEKRILQLEQRPVAAAAQHQSATETFPAAATDRSAAAIPIESSQFGPTLTVLGKALLGIAGAYLLRALAGSAVMPHAVVGAIGGAYAIGWAIAAARTFRRFAAGLYAATSVLILAPMLWEMCLRFQAMTPLVAGGVLTAYIAIVILTARSDYRSPAFSVAFAGSAITALALCIGTHDMALFTAILLVMVLFGELVRLRARATSISPIVLLTADLSTCALLFIYRLPLGSRSEYPALGPVVVIAAPLVLFVIQAAAVALHTLVRRQKITVFDALQTMTAFVLLTLGFLWLFPSVAQIAVGGLCIALAVGCYWAALARFRRGADPRNFRLFATWGVVLLLAGVLLLAPLSWAAAALAFAAVGAMVAARRLESTALGFHGIIYLAAAAFASALPAYVWHTVLADMPAAPGWNLLAVSALAVVAYAACPEQNAERFERQALHFVLALLAACAVCALLMHALLVIATLVLHPDVFHIALLRTVAVCALALTLAIGGSRLQRTAMSRVAYALVAFVVLKLLFEDLWLGHLGYVAASIGIVALTLMAVPRTANRTSAN